jgi:glycosyltransferase involved in cell wall biosynthesis
VNQIAVLLTVYINDDLGAFKVALDSLYKQTIESFDIFVQEDGLVDVDIHEHLTQELNVGRIKHLGERVENKGFDYSLNELIDKVLMTEYEYIVRMDADDVSMPERLERQLDFMNENLDIDVCGTYIEEFGDDIEYTKVVTYPLTHNAMLGFFKKRVPIAHVSAFFRRRFFEKAGLYEVDGHFNNGDTLMWMKGFASGCRFANIGFIGVKVRVSQDFFGRRGGWKKTVSDFKNRMTVNKNLHYGFSAYFYAVAVASVNMMPSTLKKYAYKYLRQ